MSNKIIERVCCVCGKKFNYQSSINGEYYCYKHYEQVKKYGYHLDNTPRGKYDRNDYRIIDDKAIFDTYDKNNVKNREFIIDLEDLDKVKDKKWRNHNGRISTTKNGKNIHLNRFLLNLGDFECNGLVVDHIDGNPLNNSKNNLRVCNRSENSRNMHLTKSTGYVGISRDAVGNRLWYARIYFKRKGIRLFSSSNLKEVVYARYIAEELVYKEYTEQEEHKRKYDFTKDLPQDIKDAIKDKVSLKIKEAYEIVI